MDSDSESDESLFDFGDDDEDEDDAHDEEDSGSPLHVDSRCCVGHDGRLVWNKSPRSLKNLCVGRLIESGGDGDHRIPATLYSDLLQKALRLKAVEFSCHLISTWPHQVLDLHRLLTEGGATYNKKTSLLKTGSSHNMSIADIVVRGLLKTRKVSKLQRVIIPHIESEGVLLTSKFCSLPIMAMLHRKHELPALLRSVLPNKKDIELIVNHFENNLFGKCEITDECGPISIHIPLVVEHVPPFQTNMLLTLVGLTLQQYSPIKIQATQLQANHLTEDDAWRKLLELMDPHESLKYVQLKLHEDLEDLAPLAAYCGVLQTFTNVQSMTIISDHHRANIEHHNALQKCNALLQSWRNLKELNLTRTSLSCRLGALLGNMQSNIVSLTLVGCNLDGEDLKYLATSQHASSIEFLNLDQNNLHQHIDNLLELTRGLTSLVTLRTCAARLTLSDAMRMTSALTTGHLHSWYITQNDLQSFHELYQFLQNCSQISSLREVACKPIAVGHRGGLLRHKVATSSDQARDQDLRQLVDLVQQLNLIIY